MRPPVRQTSAETESRFCIANLLCQSRDYSFLWGSRSRNLSRFTSTPILARVCLILHLQPEADAARFKHPRQAPSLVRRNANLRSLWPLKPKPYPCPLQIYHFSDGPRPRTGPESRMGIKERGDCLIGLDGKIKAGTFSMLTQLGMGCSRVVDGPLAVSFTSSWGNWLFCQSVSTYSSPKVCIGIKYGSFINLQYPSSSTPSLLPLSLLSHLLASPFFLP